MRATSSPRCAVNAAFLVGLAALAVSAVAHACPVGRSDRSNAGGWWEAEDGHRMPSLLPREPKLEPQPSTPPAKLTAITVVGDLAESTVRRVVRRNLDAVAACRRTAKTALEIVFRVAPNGAPTNVAVTGTDDTAARCVSGVIQTIAIPVDGNGAMVAVSVVM